MRYAQYKTGDGNSHDPEGTIDQDAEPEVSSPLFITGIRHYIQQEEVYHYGANYGADQGYGHKRRIARWHIVYRR